MFDAIENYHHQIVIQMIINQCHHHQNHHQATILCITANVQKKMHYQIQNKLNVPKVMLLHPSYDRDGNSTRNDEKECLITINTQPIQQNYQGTCVIQNQLHLFLYQNHLQIHYNHHIIVNHQYYSMMKTLVKKKQ